MNRKEYDSEEEIAAGDIKEENSMDIPTSGLKYVSKSTYNFILPHS
jgi:hypothetical protein